jgi:hypothetical protein
MWVCVLYWKYFLENLVLVLWFNVVRLTLIVKMSGDVGLYKKFIWRRQQQQQFVS